MLLGVLAVEPLTPGADEARRQLELELARPEYDQLSPLERVIRWVESLLPTPGSTGLNVQLGVLVVALLLIIGLALLLWRVADARQVARQRRRRARGLADPDRSAQSYREEAQAHLARGAYDRAVVATFRALVVGLDERDIVLDAPGRTAHEVTDAASRARALDDRDARWAAACFDAACYGHPDGPLPGPDEPQRTTREDVLRLQQLERRGADAPT